MTSAPVDRSSVDTVHSHNERPLVGTVVVACKCVAETELVGPRVASNKTKGDRVSPWIDEIGNALPIGTRHFLYNSAIDFGIKCIVKTSALVCAEIRVTLDLPNT